LFCDPNVVCGTIELESICVHLPSLDIHVNQLVLGGMLRANAVARLMAVMARSAQTRV
jgi:hypothetical protein